MSNEILINGKIYNETGKTNIQETVALLQTCKYFITNDAGPMHIASAAGVKVISLFGPTNPKRKAPMNKGSVAIWNDQKVYDEKYELYGKTQNNKFFEKIDKHQILRLIK